MLQETVSVKFQILSKFLSLSHNDNFFIYKFLSR